MSSTASKGVFLEVNTLKICLLSGWILLAGAWLAGGSPLQAASPESATPTGDIARGKKVYLEVCLPCHGPDPAQDGPLGPRIKGASPELLLHRVVSATYPKGYKPLRPTKLMPAMPALKDSIGDLAAYLR